MKHKEKTLKISLESIYQEPEGTTKIMVDMPLNVPIVWKIIDTPMGKRLGFETYKKWYEFWK